MRIKEQCACGAVCEVETSSGLAVIEYVQAWRLAHTCPAAHELAEKGVGFTISKKVV